MVKFFLSVAIVAAVAATPTATIAAEDLFGPYFYAEGALGADFGSSTGNGYVAYGAPWLPWEAAISGTGSAVSGRIGFGYDFLNGDGVPTRLGLTLDGTLVSQNRDVPVFGWVMGEPGVGGAKPMFEISIDDSGTLQLGLQSSVKNTFWEVMPEFLMGSQYDDMSVLWLGVQPFYGERSERSSYSAYRVAPSMRVDTAVDAQMYGALLTAQHETWLRDDLKLFVSAGAGAYTLNATSHVSGATHGGVVDDARSMAGFRGQLGVGVDLQVTEKLSLGVVGRADVWSALPHVSGLFADWGGSAPCAEGPPLVCTPPAIRGDYKMSADPHANLFIGLRVVYRP